jgi:hypothetical protein
MVIINRIKLHSKLNKLKLNSLIQGLNKFKPKAQPELKAVVLLKTIRLEESSGKEHMPR